MTTLYRNTASRIPNRPSRQEASLDGRAALAEEAVAAAVSFAAVAGLAADNGGYFPTTWGWAAVGLCLVAVVLLAVHGAPRLRPVEKLVLAAAAGISAWTFASAIWSISVTRTFLEGERSLVYVSGIAVALLLSRRAGGRAIVLGTWLGITAVCTYSLLTRVFPRQFGSFDSVSANRLSSPIGYWNGLALFAAVGCLLAVGLAARGGTWVRMAAAASTVVFLPTLYFTFGRGGWVALFAGLLAAVIADRRRTQLLVTMAFVAPWPAIAVYVASRADALTHTGSTIGAAQTDGHAVAVICVVMIVLAALAMLALDLLEERRQLVAGRRLRRVVAILLVCLLSVVVTLAFARYGSPATIARDGWHSFTGGDGESGPNLNGRLFHLSGTGRIAHWRVAAREAEAHPWLGSGAGTFSEYWFQYRPSTVIVHDAHTLYLETLAETGPIGLALIVLLLGGLLVGAVRARTPLAAVAAGACVAYSLHAAVDWDWELPALLLAVAFPALAVLGDPAPRAAPVRSRLLPAGAAVAVGAFALFTLLGNIALADSSNASDATRWKQAESDARSALGLVPWSAEPDRKLAIAQAGFGRIAAAQESLRDAVDREPRDWSLWYQLSQVTTGAEHRRALAQANRLNPNRTDGEAAPDDLRLVLIP
jgi:heme exporter protein D